MSFRTHPPPCRLAQAAGNAALERINRFVSNSRLEKGMNNTGMQLEWEDLEIGPQVGEGSFSNVFAVVLHPTRRKSDSALLSFSENDEESDNEAEKDHGEDDSERRSHQQFALKCLKPHVTTEEQSFNNAAADLALEAQLLSRLSHPHIIQLHGVTAGCVSSSFLDNKRGFFLVLDLMTDTLDHKLAIWKDQSMHKKRPFYLRSARPVAAAQLDRLEQIALGICRGLEYLHQNNILYRDIKPQNIGFDENDCVRIFDFGFAREVPRTAKDHDLRQVTGEAGTPRYMSPEMARMEPFNFSSDVYSFAVLLWEICVLKKPFEEIKDRDLFERKVVHEHYRPSLKKIGVEQLKPLLQQAWQDDPKKRPSISVFRATLERIITEATKEAPAQQRTWFRRRTNATEFVSVERGRGGGLDSGKLRSSFLKDLSQGSLASTRSTCTKESRNSSSQMAAKAMAARLERQMKADEKYLRHKRFQFWGRAGRAPRRASTGAFAA